MKNNKGQVLTAFIIVIPIIFMLMAVIFDIGLLYIEKRKIDNQLKDTIYYAFNNNKNDNEIENNIIKIVKENYDYDKLIVDKNDNNIKIELKKTYKSLFSLMFKKANYEIITKYRALKVNDEIVIRKGK